MMAGPILRQERFLNSVTSIAGKAFLAGLAFVCANDALNKQAKKTTIIQTRVFLPKLAILTSLSS